MYSHTGSLTCLKEWLTCTRKPLLILMLPASSTQGTLKQEQQRREEHCHNNAMSAV